MHSLREQLHDNNSSDDHCHANDSWPVRNLLVEKNRNDGDQHNPNTGPGSISDPHRNHLQREGQEVEGSTIAKHHDQAGPEFGEVFCSFEETGPDHFTQDRQRQIKVVHELKLSLLAGDPSDGSFTGLSQSFCHRRDLPKSLLPLLQL